MSLLFSKDGSLCTHCYSWRIIQGELGKKRKLKQISEEKNRKDLRKQRNIENWKELLTSQTDSVVNTKLGPYPWLPVQTNKQKWEQSVEIPAILKITALKHFSQALIMLAKYPNGWISNHSNIASVIPHFMKSKTQISITAWIEFLVA